MKITKNESGLDRIIRLVLAVIMFYLANSQMTGVWQTVVYVLSVILLVTAITGFCGIYKLLGISTVKETPQV